MKWVVVSDNHGDSSVLEEIVKEHKATADTFIHCGDSELLKSSPIMEHFHAVRGNCDMDREFPLHITEEVQGKKYLVVHGHMENIKMSLLPLTYKAKEAGVSFAFFGHSHLLGVEKMDEVIYLNPGSISLPRGGNPKTYAVITFDDLEIQVTYLDEKHREVKKVNFS
ncbi:metallophosphoesterase [Mangrovibacillus cuniculi]|uniref:Phosphoesterase n=1 Tax=Mangrovibacillus cuniculi TaxID=2593652 RepID=A0A7S8CBX8_9BACI|nr:metallophosphoesterase [Mangrovibacillus cuniculi]QPC47146.1 metallophosphoesterase [Mangrovibacillus cuniculi]